jgi:hypothetical protein
VFGPPGVISWPRDSHGHRVAPGNLAKPNL